MMKGTKSMAYKYQHNICTLNIKSFLICDFILEKKYFLTFQNPLKVSPEINTKHCQNLNVKIEDASFRRVFFYVGN